MSLLPTNQNNSEDHKKTVVHLIRTQNLPIFEQLQIEEALLHVNEKDTSPNNYCLLNEGSSKSIIMGLSNKPEELLDIEKIRLDKIPVYKRFSGGGTVIVDENTLFVSMIFSKNAFAFSSFPESVMRWNYRFHKHVFNKKDFALHENDFALGEKKCAGNAQYFKQHRWIQHTTFLWDFFPDNLSMLKNPKTAPKYREGRTHETFLTTIKSIFPSKKAFFDAVETQLKSMFTVKDLSLDEAQKLLKKSYRKNNKELLF